MNSYLPHEGTYTRLEPSPHGVGVFAIVDIPKGTYIFEPDDTPIVKVSPAELNTLAQPLRRLYHDFCVLRDGVYECPVSFNQLTPSWYLNNSGDPNVAPDEELRFYALRDISAGEELTASYETYSENEKDLSVEVPEP